jgi:hypothetical protein
VQVKVDTFLNTGDAAPRIHELSMFRQGKRTESDNEDDQSDNDEPTGREGLMKELARQLDEEEAGTKAAEKVVPFRVGDLVQVRFHM